MEKEYKRTRRVRTGNTGGLFREERSQDQYAELEREFARGGSRTLRRIKESKETCSPSSRGAVRKHTWQSPGWGGRNPNSTYKETEDNIEHEDMVGSGDFRGIYPKDLESKLRRILKRIKSNMISDPVIKGKIMNTTGGRWARFCCDTGSSVNLMPAKMAAAGGLKLRPIDLDEPTYKSVTNEDLEIIGQTSAFVKLEKFKTPVKLNFLVCLDEG